MARIRISVTDLDAYRYFREREDMPLEDFLAQMRRQTKPTPAMEAGRAFHIALETAVIGVSESLERAGWRFDIDAEVEIELAPIREMKASKNYVIGTEAVTLVGKVDSLIGRTIFDHKLTGRFDPERFLQSYQWRAYLDIFECDHFVWNVFEGKPAPDNSRCMKIRNAFTLRADRYPGMAGDLERELLGFVDMAHLHLPEKFGAAA